ncbi:splicing factor 3B subunit 5/RDS3 complex subunit 10 [Rhizophagus irregularis]|uniref:Splicing factor subunit n=7 Tax=Glomeraceae TaxID=36751 RepID=A0A2N1NVS9_9GLOM|nr:splicing factor 3B subunit 5/RDS3 complex subunit 10 [Rhizophagus irregularis]
MHNLRVRSTEMDRFNLNSQLEHLQSKYVGTGHADTNKFEWMVNQHRDSYASYIGHHSLISYFAVAQNESIARVKFEFVEKMLQPCGLPVPRDE